MLFRARAVRPILLAACLAACQANDGADVPAPPRIVHAAPGSILVPLAPASVERIAYQQSRQADAAPYQLTASDGTGLRLVRVDAKAVMEGPLAFTELHLYFHNDQARTREGTFQITLPEGAAVSRFAMETNGQMQEAEVVDKQTARRAYDDALHRRQDPALLEKAPGNEFTAKVFPIAANADKHLVISFSQELPGSPYVLPLRGLPTTDRVDIHLDVLGGDGSRQAQVLQQQAWKPDRDFVSTAQTSVAAIEAGDLVAAQVAVVGDGQDGAVAADAPKAVTLLVDTSASRALGYARYVADVRALVTALGQAQGGALPVHVVAFDQESATIYSGRADGYGDAEDHALIARGAAGASDLGQALAYAQAHAAGDDRLVVVSDGVVTAGPTGGALAAQVGKLHAQRLDVALAGGIRDAQAAAALVRAGLPHAGAVLDLEADGATAVAHELGEGVQVDVAIDVPGADWVYPRVLPAVRAGERALVYARFAKPPQSVEVVVGGRSQPIPVASVEPALLERAAAGAEIRELEGKLAQTTDHGAAATLASDIAKRSVAARVISSQTAMIVLETDDDYARYGIERTALGTILTVGPSGVERTSRQTWIGGGTPQQIQRQQAPEGVTFPVKPQGVKTVARIGAGEGRDEDKEKSKKSADLSGELLLDGAPLTKDDRAPSGARGPAGDDDEGGERGAGNGAVAMGSAAAPGDAMATADIVAAVPSNVAPNVPPRTAALRPPPPAPPPPPPQPDAQPVHGGGLAPTRTRSAASANDPAPRADVIAETETSDDYLTGSLGGRSAADAWPPANAPSALEGPLAEIEHALSAGHTAAALAQATAWHERDPGDVLALIGLGDALEASQDAPRAARIYGSIIDLFPGRADMRRFAGERLARLGDPYRWLAIDTYQRAVADRPDHITGHRLLAYALVRDHQFAEAFAAILAGVDTPIPEGRYRGADRVLAEDAGMIAAAYLAAQPSAKADITAELDKRHLALATHPSTRFILYWETDANDVDFHIQDARGGHAYYASPLLPSGGSLYADITTGYGPECFNIPGHPAAGPYRLSINYYSQGPMGYGMGLLEVQRFDGQGGLQFEDRPYVIMHSQAYVDLGTYK